MGEFLLCLAFAAFGFAANEVRFRKLLKKRGLDKDALPLKK